MCDPNSVYQSDVIAASGAAQLFDLDVKTTFEEAALQQTSCSKAVSVCTAPAKSC